MQLNYGLTEYQHNEVPSSYSGVMSQVIIGDARAIVGGYRFLLGGRSRDKVETTQDNGLRRN